MTSKISVFAGSILCALGLCASVASGQGTAFTYQGYLHDGNLPANGTYDLTFSLFSAGSGGAPVAGPLTNFATGVTNGLFTVSLDFGAGPFAAGAQWLQLAVRTNGATAFIPLEPRQELTPVPFAIIAGGLAGPLPPSQFGGAYGNAVTLNNSANSFSGNGGGLTNVNASTLGGLGAGAFWNVSGNAGTTPGLNFLGTADNQPLELHVNGARALRLEPNASGAPNHVGGSPANFVDAGIVGAAIDGGGALNYGGSAFTNEIASDFGAIGGGGANRVWPQSSWGIIGGGFANAVGGQNSSIAGGSSNFTGGVNEFIGGGLGNQINAYTPNGMFGKPNGSGSSIGGGDANTIQEGNSVSFGAVNIPAGLNAVGGGGSNMVFAGAALLSVAYGNAIAGGVNNAVYGNARGQAIGGGFGNQMGMPNSGSGWCVISGGYENIITGGESYSDCNIAGGAFNIIGGYASFPGGCAIGGGEGNFADGVNSVVAGGGANSIQAQGSQVYRGSAIAGGESNLVATADWAAIGGGFFNLVSGNFAAIPGGASNTATGAYSFAAGNQAHATNQGAFVWADSTPAGIGSSAADQFTVRASGGIRLFSNPGATAGVSLAAGSGSWTSLSDRNAKEHFEPADPQAVLAKLVALPVSTWNYKSQDAAIRHIGPTAQDFKAAFAVGETDTGIATVDESGVALAAIQGLNEKLDQKDAEIRDLKQSVAELRKMLESLSGQK